jgi:hypothetical protein
MLDACRGHQHPALHRSPGHVELADVGFHQRIVESFRVEPDDERVLPHAHHVAVQNGRIIIFHDGVNPDGVRDPLRTIDAVREMVRWLTTEKNSQLVTVSELLDDYNGGPIGPA